MECDANKESLKNTTTSRLHAHRIVSRHCDNSDCGGDLAAHVRASAREGAANRLPEQSTASEHGAVALCAG